MTFNSIRPSGSETIFYIDAQATALADWLVAEKGMEREPPELVGRHWIVLHTDGAEIIIDPPASLGSATIKCYGRKKLDAAAWINEYRTRAIRREPT